MDRDYSRKTIEKRADGTAELAGDQIQVLLCHSFSEAQLHISSDLSGSHGRETDRQYLFTDLHS